MIHVMVKITARSGCEAQLRDAVRELVQATQAEPGAVSYEAFVSTNDPAVVRFAEVWRDQAALDAHNQAPHFLKFFELSAGLLGEAPEIDLVTPV